MGRGTIAVIGAGSLGSTVAYTLIMRRVVREILLVDISTEIIQAQVLDLSEAALGTTIVVRAGTFKEAGQADVILLTADVLKRHDEPYLEWIKRLRKLLSSITHSMNPIQPKARIIVGVDPVDILTRHLQTTLNLPVSQIFGAGCTAQNTARARHWLAQMSETANDTKAQIYVMGSRQVPVVAWHAALVDGQPVNTIPQLRVHRALLEQIIATDRIKEIKEYKGGAWYGHAALLSSVIRSVMSKEASIHVLSVYVDRFETCISIPVVVTRDGVQQEVPIPLSVEENHLLEHAVNNIIQQFEGSS